MPLDVHSPAEHQKPHGLKERFLSLFLKEKTQEVKRQVEKTLATPQLPIQPVEKKVQRINPAEKKETAPFDMDGHLKLLVDICTQVRIATSTPAKLTETWVTGRKIFEPVRNWWKVFRSHLESPLILSDEAAKPAFQALKDLKERSMPHEILEAFRKSGILNATGIKVGQVEGLTPKEEVQRFIKDLQNWKELLGMNKEGFRPEMSLQRHAEKAGVSLTDLDQRWYKCMESIGRLKRDETFEDFSPLLKAEYDALLDVRKQALERMRKQAEFNSTSNKPKEFNMNYQKGGFENV